MKCRKKLCRLNTGLTDSGVKICRRVQFLVTFCESIFPRLLQ